MQIYCKSIQNSIIITNQIKHNIIDKMPCIARLQHSIIIIIIILFLH